jgi:hypothetical protein
VISHTSLQLAEIKVTESKTEIDAEPILEAEPYSGRALV